MLINGKEVNISAGANLRGVNLQGADLRGADLRWADLQGADLLGADLLGADLQGADLQRAHLPSPGCVLLANWGHLTGASTLALMRLDASAHPCPSMFDKWKDTGVCPYANCNVQRVANFKENRELWSPGPPPTIWEAMCMVLDEKCPGWR